MIWAILVILVLLGYIGEVIFLKSRLKIKELNKGEVSLFLKVQKFVGLGFFIGGFISMIIITIIVFL